MRFWENTHRTRSPMSSPAAARETDMPSFMHRGQKNIDLAVDPGLLRLHRDLPVTRETALSIYRGSAL